MKNSETKKRMDVAIEARRLRLAEIKDETERHVDKYCRPPRPQLDDDGAWKKKTNKQFWIEHRGNDGELHTIGDEPFPGETAEQAFAEYSRQIVSTGEPVPDIEDYEVNEATPIASSSQGTALRGRTVVETDLIKACEAAAVHLQEVVDSLGAEYDPDGNLPHVVDQLRAAIDKATKQFWRDRRF